MPLHAVHVPAHVQPSLFRPRFPCSSSPGVHFLCLLHPEVSQRQGAVDALHFHSSPWAALEQRLVGTKLAPTAPTFWVTPETTEGKGMGSQAPKRHQAFAVPMVVNTVAESIRTPCYLKGS